MYSTSPLVKDSPVLIQSESRNNMIVTSETFKDTLKSFPDTSTWIIDVETNGLNPYDMNQLCGIGLAPLNHSENEAYYFPFRHQTDEPNLTQAELNELVQFINDKCDTIIGYNVKFDVKFLNNEGVNIDKMKFIDVIVAVRMTESSTVNSLKLVDTLIRSYGEQAGKYDIETKQILRENKWTKDFSLSPPSILGPYCIKDVYWAQKIYLDRLEKLEESGQLELFEFQCELTKTLYDMENRGITINNDYARIVSKKIEGRVKELKQRIYDLASDELLKKLGFEELKFKFNISSPQQIGRVFNLMGIHSPSTTPTGAEAWNEAVLIQLNNPLAGLIRQYRTLEKFRSTYIEPYLDMNILHTSFHNSGTVTGRLSSRNPNLQNIPRGIIYVDDRELSEEDKDEIRDRVAAIVSSKGGNSQTNLTDDVIETWSFLGGDNFDSTDEKQVSIRNLFIPRQNYKLVSYDYSQMEVRVFMNYVNNPEMNELMKKENIDFHGEAAKIAFNIEETDPEFKFYRQLAKSITFGVIYGIGKDKLALQLNSTPQEASKYKRTYLENMKGSKRFFDNVVRTIVKKGWVRNKYSRIYKVPRDVAYRGVNYLIQGTSADIMNERMVVIHNYLKDKKSNLLLQVHDEIICEIHNDEIEEVAPKIKELMVENSLNIPLEVDIELCEPSWAVKKEYQVTENKKINIIDYIDWD